jgi:hypothetical protein
MSHNALGFGYEDRMIETKGRTIIQQPKWLIQQHIVSHTTMVIGHAQTTTFGGTPCDNPNCRNVFDTTRPLCSVHVCNRCHNGFWCSKNCYDESICLHDFRCLDSPAYAMSDYTFNSLWPQYQAEGASFYSSSSSSSSTSANTRMGPPTTVNRTDTTHAISNWPTQPGLAYGIQCPTSGWTTHGPETKYGQTTYSHPQVHDGLKFEYHKIRGAYIIHNQRDPTKRLSYETSYKLFLATPQELEDENTRIGTAKKHRKPK